MRKFRIKPFVKYQTDEIVNDYPTHRHLCLRSKYLKRKVIVDIFYPSALPESNAIALPTLFLNDGQDAKQLRLHETLTERYRSNAFTDIVVIGIHAGDRMNEYGTAGHPDYMNRGKKAHWHTNFVLKELLPHLQKTVGCAQNSELMAFAGFSLGGLSAMNITWDHPEHFRKVGVFSGSFWWRMTPQHGEYRDSDRIMHHLIDKGEYKDGLSFWFQAGTKDEEADRNNNGIIDAIDDTLDIIKSLKAKGYSDEDIIYLEVEDGEHNFKTWSKVFPEFLKWAFDK
ncbi:MAG: alpha/beta hydrolase-fold protein [Bacteroidota bacterium]